MKQGNLRNCTKLRKRLLGNEQQGNLRNSSNLRNRTKLRKRLVEYRGILSGSVGDLGQNRGRFVVDPWSIWGRI
jgi:hypothetical protein